MSERMHEEYEELPSLSKRTLFSLERTIPDYPILEREGYNIGGRARVSVEQIGSRTFLIHCHAEVIDAVGVLPTPISVEDTDLAGARTKARDILDDIEHWPTKTYN